MTMDLFGVTAIREPRSDAELLPLRPGERPIGGGTWLYSEPQSGFDTIVDLTSLHWPEVQQTDETLTLAATTRLRTVHALHDRNPLFAQCTDALLASWKIWNVATIGGNLCFGAPASAMVSLCVALDASVVVWGTGTVRREKVVDFILGPQRNTLMPGELVRAIEFPRAVLTQPTAFRKIALSDLGRSGVVVIGRREPEGVLVSITAATARPRIVRSEDELDTITDWHDDAHGAPDWREAMTRRFVAEIIEELQ